MAAQNICREQFSFSTDIVFYDAIAIDSSILLCGNTLVNGSHSGAMVAEYRCKSIRTVYKSEIHASSSITPFFQISNTIYFGEIEEYDSVSIVRILQWTGDSIVPINVDTLPLTSLYIREAQVNDNRVLLVGECIDQSSSNYTDIILIGVNSSTLRIENYKIYNQQGFQFGTSTAEIGDSIIAIAGIFYRDLTDTLPYSSYTNSLLMVDTTFMLKEVLYLPNNIWNNTSLLYANRELYVAGMDIVLDTTSLQSNDRIVLAKIIALEDPVIARKSFIPTTSNYTISALHPVDFFDNSFLLGGTSKFDSSTSNYAVITGFGSIDNDYVIAKFDTNLTQQWIRFYGVPDAYEFLWKVLALDDGGCLLVGTTYDYVNATEQKRDLYIVRLDSNGNTFNTAIAPGVLPDNAYRLYPNPANSHLTLRLPNSAYGHLQLFNRTGQMVLHDRVEDYQTISVAHLPPGLYLYQLTDAEQRIASGKVVVQ